MQRKARLASKPRNISKTHALFFVQTEGKKFDVYRGVPERRNVSALVKNTLLTGDPLKRTAAIMIKDNSLRLHKGSSSDNLWDRKLFKRKTKEKK